MHRTSSALRIVHLFFIIPSPSCHDYYILNTNSVLTVSTVGTIFAVFSVKTIFTVSAVLTIYSIFTVFTISTIDTVFAISTNYNTKVRNSII